MDLPLTKELVRGNFSDLLGNATVEHLANEKHVDKPL